MTPKQLQRIAKALSGKTIAVVDMRPFDLGWDAYGANPRIEFTDGSVLEFVIVNATIEDANGEAKQGVQPVLTSAKLPL